MPKLSSNKVPRYRRHKQSGRAIVTLSGKDFLLPGDYGSAASKAEYDRLTSEWIAAGRCLPKSATDTTVVELVARFWTHATTYYRRPDGTPTSELKNLRDAARPLQKLYGRTTIGEFGPLALKTVRQEMIRLGWCRTNINRAVGRVKLIFRWGVENQIVPAPIYQELLAVAGLSEGRSDARESIPVGPVPDAYVTAVLQHVSPPIAALIELQAITGMRSGEATSMRGCDLDTTGKVWLYKPATHKTQHHGHARQVYLGPRCREIVSPFLKTDLSAHLFSPADAMEYWREQRHKARKTPRSCGNVAGSNRSSKPRKSPGTRYTPEAYAKAIYAGCDRAFPPPDDLLATIDRLAVEMAAAAPKSKASADLAKKLDDAQGELRKWRKDHRWHPHQLRHSAGTRFRKEYGLEAAQVLLGHKTLTVTQVYAEKNVETAQRVMALHG